MDQVLSFQPSIHLPRRNFHSLRGVLNRHYSKVDMPICSCFQRVGPSACVLLYMSLQSRRGNFVVSQPQTLRFPLFIYTFYMFYTAKTNASSAHPYRETTGSDTIATVNYHSSSAIPSQTNQPQTFRLLPFINHSTRSTCSTRLKEVGVMSWSWRAE